MSISVKILLLLALTVSAVLAEPQGADWYGQPLPGAEAVRFAPAVLFNSETDSTRTEIHGTPQFSWNGKWMLIEFQYYDKKTQVYEKSILMSTFGSDGWSKLQPVPFSGEFSDSNPVFHPDGKRLFFVSDRDNDSRFAKEEKDIWFIEIKDRVMGLPQRLGSPINSAKTEGSPAFTEQGQMYFYRRFEKEDGSGEIMISMEGKDGFTEPSRVSTINGESFEFPTLVDSQDRWIIFGSARGYPEKAGLYISRRLKDGDWSTPKSLPENINGHGLAFTASLTPDKKHFFFLNRSLPEGSVENTIREEGVFWLTAEFIESQQ